ncbi:MAG: hypothetical protein ACTSUG_07970 [Candidatus Helarchaeota archaeon]
MALPKNWISRDGDVILTTDNFIMYTFGYDHPKNKVISYLKYIPENLIKLFNLPYIEHKWKFKNIIMRRPKELYSPEIFNEIINVFKNHFPNYVDYSNHLQKEIIVVPYSNIKKIFTPDLQLKRLLKKEILDKHESIAIELIKLLSYNSNVSLESFGIHGSTSYQMHSEQSDVDIAIYGSDNYFKVKQTVKELVDKKIITYNVKIQTDKYRLNRGKYKETDFVFNAIRTLKETKNNYDTFQFKHIIGVKFSCQIINNTESVFRPAIYKVSKVKLNKKLDIDENEILEVVSMIGEYRNIANEGSYIKGFGMLEKVKNLKQSKNYYRIIIGSGVQKEYITPK